MYQCLCYSFLFAVVVMCRCRDLCLLLEDKTLLNSQFNYENVRVYVCFYGIYSMAADSTVSPFENSSVHLRVV